MEFRVACNIWWHNEPNRTRYHYYYCWANEGSREKKSEIYFFSANGNRWWSTRTQTQKQKRKKKKKPTIIVKNEWNERDTEWKGEKAQTFSNEIGKVFNILPINVGSYIIACIAPGPQLYAVVDGHTHFLCFLHI